MFIVVSYYCFVFGELEHFEKELTTRNGSKNKSTSNNTTFFDLDSYFNKAQTHNVVRKSHFFSLIHCSILCNY